MKILTMEQGTPEWKKARAGKVTASKITDLQAKLKNGSDSKERISYKFQIVSEMLTGEPSEDIFQNAAMRWGVEKEPFARNTYAIISGVSVVEVGMVLHPTIDNAAASPDGLVGEDGLLEIKCPQTKTHLQYLLEGVVPAQYQPQMLWQMACTGRAWCDFVSYDPRLPEHLQYFCIRFMRDDARIQAMEADVKAFLEECYDLVAKLNEGAA